MKFIYAVIALFIINTYSFAQNTGFITGKIIDAKRNEIAEKRAEELVDAYLKNKQMRVRFY
jgi:hypothetical protein